MTDDDLGNVGLARHCRMLVNEAADQKLTIGVICMSSRLAAAVASQIGSWLPRTATRTGADRMMFVFVNGSRISILSRDPYRWRGVRWDVLIIHDPELLQSGEDEHIATSLACDVRWWGQE